MSTLNAAGVVRIGDYCGNGWMAPASEGNYGPPPPPQDPSCGQLLEGACPSATFVRRGKDGEADCRSCVLQLKQADEARWNASCAPPPPPPSGGGSRRRRGGGGRGGPSDSFCRTLPSPFAMNYIPFATPQQSFRSCFDAAGEEWAMSNCTFNQWAGELWNARLHQYLVANGVAVVTLNPYTQDTCVQLTRAYSVCTCIYS